MFKARKKNFLAGNVRKTARTHDEEAGDEEADNNIPNKDKEDENDDDEKEKVGNSNDKKIERKKSQSQKQKKKESSKISFLGDESEEEEASQIFQVKKSKLSKSMKKKKLPQAPVIIEQQEKATTAYGSTSTGGEDYLSSLRKEQNYSAPRPPEETSGFVEGLELTGAEAESMEEFTESLAENVQSIEEMENAEKEVVEDFIPLGVQKHDPTQSVLGAKNVVELEPEDEGDSGWEDQLAKRAGVSINDSSSTQKEDKHLQSNATRTEDLSTKMSNAEKVLDNLSYKTVKRSLRSQIASLSERTDVMESRLRAQESLLQSHQKESAELKRSISQKTSQQDFLKKMRLFVSDLCGMLREKEELISQLRQAVLDYVEDYSSRRLKTWRHLQDQVLSEMRQSGCIISLGGYLPASKNEPPTSSMQFPTLEDELKSIRLDEEKLSQGMTVFKKAALTLLQDVRPDLSTLPAVLKPFREFRQTHLKKYNEAYISLSLSEILEHFLLLDIVPTYILDSGELNKFRLDKCEWFSALLEFSTEGMDVSRCKENVEKNSIETNASNHATFKESEEACLLPRMIKRVLLPWYAKFMEAALNPMSSSQMKSCSDLVKEVALFDVTEEQLAPLCKCILDAVTRWMGAVCVPVIKAAQSTSLIVNFGSVQYFVRQQLDRLSVILENLSFFVEILSSTALAKLAWTSLVTQAQSAMVKLLAGGDEQDKLHHEAELEKLRNYATSCRFLKATMCLLPSDSTACKKSGIPEASLRALESLVLDEIPPNTVTSEVVFRRDSMLKCLRHLSV